MKEIRKASFEIYKKHPFNSWILSLICALFIGSMCLLGLVLPILPLFLVPFIFLPFFFACTVSHLDLRDKDELSGKRLFTFFRMYFKTPYFNSFSFFKSALKTIVAAIIINFVAIGICYAIYSQSETFMVTLNSLIDEMRNSNYISEEVINNAFSANNYEFNNFYYLINAISLCGTAMVFIFFISHEAITIYPRVILRQTPLAHRISRALIMSKAKEYNKRYFALNFPLFILLLAGMIGGIVLSTFVFNYNVAGIVGLSMGIGLTVIYLPFYFSNMEAIYDSLEFDLVTFSNKYLTTVFERFGVKVDEKEEDGGDKKDSN